MILGSKLVQENGVKSRCKDKYPDLCSIELYNAFLRILLCVSFIIRWIELRDQFFVFSGAKILPFFELASIFANFFSKNFRAHSPFWHYLS